MTAGGTPRPPRHLPAGSRTSARRSTRASSDTSTTGGSTGYYEARADDDAAFADDDRMVNLTLTVDPGPARARRLRRRSAAGGSPRRARAGRARRIGGRGSARGLEQPDRGVSARAGYRDARRRTRARRADGELLITFDVKKGAAVPRGVGRDRRQRVGAADRAAAKLRVRAGQPFSAAALDADVVHDRRALPPPRFRGRAQADATTPSRAGGSRRSTCRWPFASQVTENVRTIVNSVRIEGNQAFRSRS